MKRTFLAILTCALLVFGVAAPGHATPFQQGDLIMEAYDVTTGVEVGVDLGSLTTLLGQSGPQNPGSAIALSTFNGNGQTATWGQVQVAYFEVTGSQTGETSNTNNIVVSATSTPTSGTNSWSTVVQAQQAITNYYTSLPGGSVVTANTTFNTGGSAGRSYYEAMDGAGTYGGSFAEFLNNTTYGGEITPGSSPVTQYLYQWIGSTVGQGARGVTEGGLNYPQAGTLIASVETLETGSGTEIETEFTSAVPLPPSAFLMAPALLGLIGLRKRKGQRK